MSEEAADFCPFNLWPCESSFLSYSLNSPQSASFLNIYPSNSVSHIYIYSWVFVLYWEQRGRSCFTAEWYECQKLKTINQRCDEQLLQTRSAQSEFRLVITDETLISAPWWWITDARQLKINGLITKYRKQRTKVTTSRTEALLHVRLQQMTHS